MLTILGIGTGEFSSLTIQGYELLTLGGTIVLQTDRIPLAQELMRRGITFCSLDACYEQAEDFEEFQELALEYLEKQKDALLCILGDLYTNTLVQALLRRCEAQLIPGVGLAAKRCRFVRQNWGKGRLYAARHMILHKRVYRQRKFGDYRGGFPLFGGRSSC